MRLGALHNNVLFSEAEHTSPAPTHSKPRHVGVGLACGAVINTERLNPECICNHRREPSAPPRWRGGGGGVDGFAHSELSRTST